jgi:release factor glutamine methyltransferase
VNPVRTASKPDSRSFNYHDLTISLHPEVYDPAEDSFALLDSLKITSKDTILELGTGCGVIALACACQGAKVLCTDINPYAVRLTRQNIERNRHLLTGHIEVRQGNLFSVVKNSERFTIILFNPPYLPTKRNERTDTWFNVATDGGPTGLQWTKQFLQGLRKHLQPDGAGYFLFSSLSKRSLLEKYLKDEQFSSMILTTQRYDGEDLDVYRVTPTA